MLKRALGLGLWVSSKCAGVCHPDVDRKGPFKEVLSLSLLASSPGVFKTLDGDVSHPLAQRVVVRVLGHVVASIEQHGLEPLRQVDHLVVEGIGVAPLQQLHDFLQDDVPMLDTR
jgi:hypothetical protein